MLICSTLQIVQTDIQIEEIYHTQGSNDTESVRYFKKQILIHSLTTELTINNCY